MPRFKGPDESYFLSVRDFFLRTEDVEKAIDVIELSFRFIDKVVRDHPNKLRGVHGISLKHSCHMRDVARR